MKFDLKELDDDRERNFEERLRFIDLYVEWLRRTPNEVWSRQQKEMVDAGANVRKG
jgi:hypothetical protein